MTSIITVSSRSRFRVVVTAVIASIAFWLPGLTRAQAPISFQFTAEVVTSTLSDPVDNVPVGTVITGRVTYDATSIMDMNADTMFGEFALPSPANQGSLRFPLLTTPPSFHRGTTLTTTSDLDISTRDAINDDAVQISASGSVLGPSGFVAVAFSLDFPTDGTMCADDILSSDAVPDRVTLELFFNACGATLFVTDSAGTVVHLRAEMASITVDPIAGFGTATIDGAFVGSEWDNAATAKFGVLLPNNTTVEAEMFVMNDASNLYVGVQYPRIAADDRQSLIIRFDNNGDGKFIEPAFNIPEDSVSFDGTTMVFRDSFSVASRVTPASPSGWFGDSVSCPAGKNCIFSDVTDGGTTDGAGAFGNDTTLSTFELSHPFNSGDQFPGSVSPDIDAYDRDISVAFDAIGVALVMSLTDDPTGITTQTIFSAGHFGGTDGFIEVLIDTLDPAPVALDDLATTDCGVDTDIFVLNNDEFLIDAEFVVSAQTPTEKGGTTVVHGSPNANPALIFVTYTSADGFDGTDTFEYTVTDENGSGESDTATVTIEVDGNTCQVEPGDTTIFGPAQTMTAAVQEVVKPGTISQFSCAFVVEDGDRLVDQELDLIDKINNEPDCSNVADELVPTDAAKLKKYQRAFVDQDGKKRIVVTLIRSKNTNGDPDDLTKGVVISEEGATKQGVFEPICEVGDVSQSPSTVGVNLSGNEPSGIKARNWTITCNRTRSGGRFSDQLLAFPIRNDSAFLRPIPQVNQEAANFRNAVFVEQEAGCVDSANNGRFLRDILKTFNSAWRLVGRKKYEEAITGLEAATLIALDPGGLDPYGSCPNDPKGHFVSRLMDLTYHVHRSLLFPDRFVKFEIDQAILDELPLFPGDSPPIP